MADLVTVDDARDIGFDLDQPKLKRASSRIEIITGGQKIRRETSTETVVITGTSARLSQRPVVSIDEVTGDSDIEYVLARDKIVVTNGATGTFQVTYTHGYSPVPTTIIELVCLIASRFGSENKRSMKIEDYEEQYYSDAALEAGGLLPSELALLQAFYPEASLENVKEGKAFTVRPGNRVNV